MLGVAFAGTTVVATAAPASAATCVSGSAVTSAITRAEAGFVAKLNAVRQSRGLGALAVNDALAGTSRGWSQTMSGQNWLHHAVDTGAGDGVEPHQDYVYAIKTTVPNWRAAGENVGRASMGSWCTSSELVARTDSTVNTLHNAFVNSSGHFRNMIGGFNQVGIGVHIDSSQMWVTVRFATGDVPYTAQQRADAAEYIHSVHRLFLGRNASSSEISNWTGRVLAGDRTSLTKALAVSQEWAGVRINELYSLILGRTNDQGGMQYWLGTIRGGSRLEDVATYFYGSIEFYRRVGNTDASFVNALYDQILHRSADASGRSYWVSVMRQGKSRSSIADGFYKSIESRRDRVTRLYREVLGRNPDTGGREYWAGRLVHEGDVTLAAYLASSPEYWNRATR